MLSTYLLAAASVKEGNSQNKSNDQLHSRLSKFFFVIICSMLVQIEKKNTLLRAVRTCPDSLHNNMQRYISTPHMYATFLSHKRPRAHALTL